MGVLGDSFNLRSNRFGLAIGLAGTLINRFNNPGIQGLSNAEQKALAQYNSDQQDRKLRLAQQAYNSGRVALGVVGGARTLLYGSYAGVNSSLGQASPLGVNAGGGGSTASAGLGMPNTITRSLHGEAVPLAAPTTPSRSQGGKLRGH